MLKRLFEKLDASAGRINGMMDKLGVDAVALAQAGEGQSVRQVFTRCIACQSTEECEHYLAGAANATSPADFCPNHERLMRHKA